MEVSYKINRRSRIQPFDLRRKVLLKNFLREQMTYIPQTRLVCAIQDLDASFSKGKLNSSELEENLEELNDENSSSSVSCTSNESSSYNTEENNLEPTTNNGAVINTSDTAKGDVPVPEPKLFNLGSFMRLRSGFKKSKTKGIVKAKKVCKNVKGPFKREFLKNSLRSLSMRSRTLNKNKPQSENSSKSLLSLLKSRKERRKAKKVDCTKQSASSVNQTSSTNKTSFSSNQSVQTDDSWTRQELNRVEQSNKLLREEIRLLSESLSYFMRSSSIDSQLNYCGSPLQSSNRNMNDLNRSCGHSDIPSSSHDFNNNDWTPRSKLLRSKSVQEQADRRSTTRYCYRTRSMNYHNIRNNVHHESSSSVSSLQPPSRPYINPRTRKNNVLTSLPVNATGRVVQRRSSMPERTLSENDRSRICRRSGSVRDTRRTPFHALPAEAFY